MRMKEIGKKRFAVLFIMVTCVSCFAGCGRASVTEEQVGETSTAEEQGQETSAVEEQSGNETVEEEQGGEASAAEEQAGNEAAGEGQSRTLSVPNDGRGELISDEDAAALEYMKKYMVEDTFGDGAAYEVYAPDGSENADGFLGYIDHGINFFASVYSGGGDDLPYMMLNESLKSLKTDWESSGCSDIQLGEVVKNGEDRYVVASAMGKDFYETPYQETRLYYLDVPKTGVGVLWQMEIKENQMDELTEPILAQIGQCYGIDTQNLIPDGGWEEGDAERKVKEQDVYEHEVGEQSLTGVDGYQYLGKTMLSFEDGEIKCPAMAPMGATTRVSEDHITASMHGVSVYINGFSIMTDQYVPRMKKDAEWDYEQKTNEEYGENREVHQSDIMEMAGFENAYYYILDYETPDIITEEYYRETKVTCWIVIGEQYVLGCDITLRDKEFDTATNALLRELETAYGIDLSEYYNEE